jgi:hypothetical protein
LTSYLRKKTFLDYIEIFAWIATKNKNKKKFKCAISKFFKFFLNFLKGKKAIQSKIFPKNSKSKIFMRSKIIQNLLFIKTGY